MQASTEKTESVVTTIAGSLFSAIQAKCWHFSC